MLNLSPYRDHQQSPRYSEKIDSEVFPRQFTQKSPRHISCLESKNHRQIGDQSKTSQLRTTCPTNLANEQPETSNIAVNILKYQLSDRIAQQKHVENVRRNLQHRLEVAQEQENQRLVNILQEESRLLETS